MIAISNFYPPRSNNTVIGARELPYFLDPVQSHDYKNYHFIKEERKKRHNIDEMCALLM